MRCGSTINSTIYMMVKNGFYLFMCTTWSLVPLLQARLPGSQVGSEQQFGSFDLIRKSLAIWIVAVLIGYMVIPKKSKGKFEDRD